MISKVLTFAAVLSPVLVSALDNGVAKLPSKLSKLPLKNYWPLNQLLVMGYNGRLPYELREQC